MNPSIPTQTPTRTIENQFNASNYSVPTFISKSENWVDNSWKNDVCPCFINEKLGLMLWIETDKESLREDEWQKRYTLYRMTSDLECDWDQQLIETESPRKLNSYLIAFFGA